MRSIAALIRLFVQAWREVLPILRSLWEHFALARRRDQREREESDRDRRRAKSRCVPIDEWAYKRPDPMIYSQLYLMAMGWAVTWDNPDIRLFRNGSLVPSSQLSPDTEYEIEARVWNNSTDAPAIDLPVHFGFLSFGVGANLHAIDTDFVDLGVKGGPNNPAFAKVKWRTPAVGGHYCLQVLLEWSDDANSLNNIGSENTDVAVAHSDAEFSFVVRNTTPETQRYQFETDIYTIPKRQPCGDPNSNADRRSEDAPDDTVPTAHDPRTYALPPGWEVRIKPDPLELSSDEEQVVQVAVSVPDNFKGRQPVNIRAFHSLGSAGGVTIYVEGI